MDDPYRGNHLSLTDKIKKAVELLQAATIESDCTLENFVEQMNLQLTPNCLDVSDDTRYISLELNFIARFNVESTKKGKVK